MTWNERKFVNDVLAQNVKDVLAQNVNDVMLDRACAPYGLCHFKINWQKGRVQILWDFRKNLV